MKIITCEDGAFPEINHLNHDFKTDSLRLRITLDTTLSRDYYINLFPKLLFTVLDIFPNIRKHHCSHGQNSDTLRENSMDHLPSPIKLVGDVIDTVHLFEHLTLELQCLIGQMAQCSGLTCNYWSPENRFDVYIECDDSRIAQFSCNAAIALFNNMLHAEEKMVSTLDAIYLAQTISKAGWQKQEIIKQKLGWSELKFEQAEEHLRTFAFPFRALSAVA